MKNGNGYLPISEGTDEIYTSPNIAIRWLGNRLISDIASLMSKVGADALSGLNVGCGEGQMISRLFQSGMRHKITAVDIDPARIAFAYQHNPVCDYIRADIFHLPFKSRAFDYVIATEILEHLSNPSVALKEIARVAKPNSPVILSVPHEPFFQWGNIVRGKHWKRWGRTPSHVQFWSRSEFQRLIGNVIEIQEERWISCFPWQLYLGKFKPTRSE
ncbi:MAG: class I SAM-dependent methyltransferase [Desulfobacterium sp.]|nr:class I SAM-dependent methyltransferase [Desulfobacterium sp.]MBU3948425.1 class I SAM-dependent methyltransferase [Pseudomonadota bacterium]MBU4037940.1 class I SAM-dependent methyltransferase [Pseudomonadota bacterium]